MFFQLPFPFTNSPTFLSLVLRNHLHTQRKRGVMMNDIEASKPDQVEEDFIDIEVNSSDSKEFEFHMSSSSLMKEVKSPSPADELFYKGKLLPLHLPPRVQMIQKLLHNSITSPTFHVTQDQAITAPPTSSNTPLESCNISPSESCRPSCELNPDEYFFQWSTEESAFIGCSGGGGVGDTHLSRKPWCKKIRLIKQSSLTQKLKSSRAYLRSLFMKSACSDESNCPKTIGGVPHSQDSAFAMKNILDGAMDDQISFSCHRRSFSEAIKRHCTSKCYSSSTTTSTSPSSNFSSSSSSFSLKSSNGFYEISLLKRSTNANSEGENSIEGAIAHCKKSQLKHDSSDSKMASRVAACGGDNGRPEISRI